MASYGQRFVETVGAYLRANKLVNSKGQITLGKINSKVLADLADKFEQAERRRDKKERTEKLSKSERDRLFEAIAIGTGSDPKTMTEPEIRRACVSVAAIVRATPDVTPEEIAEACRRYPSVMNGATISTSAIMNNWSKLVTPGRADPTKIKAPAGWWLQPKFDWYRVIALIWPRESNPHRGPWEEGEWELVPINIKKRIHAEGPAILEKNI